METQIPAVSNSKAEFLPGAFVIYGMHGKCQVLGIELRKLGEQSIQFYKLELLKFSPSKSQRNESAIWVPIATAREQGLRLMMTQEETEHALELLKSKETFFSLEENWNMILPKLEKTIRAEGGIGLAKVASYLHVLRKKQAVPSPALLKLQESVHKLLFRELSEILNKNLKDIELIVKRAFQSKPIPLN